MTCSSPFTAVQMLRVHRSLISSRVTNSGPIGANGSRLFPRKNCLSSPCWRSRALTSLRIVQLATQYRVPLAGDVSSRPPDYDPQSDLEVGLINIRRVNVMITRVGDGTGQFYEQ